MSVLVNGELVLYGFVGDNFWGDGFTAKEVVDALAEHGRDNDITVRINSGGGYVDDGVAIFNALSGHKGKVTVVADALAASSASIIFMAGDERIMRKGAMIMIHDPASVVWGTAEDMSKAVKMLEKHAEDLAGIYADVTGEDAEDIRADMKAETWLSADEAVDRGFATSTADKEAKAAAAFDYAVYARAPDRLVALSTKRDWNHEETGADAPSRVTAAAKTPLRHEKETNMTVTKTAEETAADTQKAIAEAATKAAADAKDRIRAIMASDDAKGRETLASHFAYETDMSVDQAVAALKVAPKAEASPDPKPAASTYEQQRVAAANLAMPGAASAPVASQGKSLNPMAIYAARREANRGA